MAKGKQNYYKRLNDDMRDVYAERNVLRSERDSLRKSIEAMRKKVKNAYADIERREEELRKKEAMEIGEWAYEKQKRIIDRNKELSHGIACRDSLIRDMYADLQRILEGGRKLEYEERIKSIGIEVSR